MIYPADTKSKVNTDTIESKAITDTSEDQRLVLDGTANLDYPDDDKIPRIKGLIELLTQYFANKPDQKL